MLKVHLVHYQKLRSLLTAITESLNQRKVLFDYKYLGQFDQDPMLSKIIPTVSLLLRYFTLEGNTNFLKAREIKTVLAELENPREKVAPKEVRTKSVRSVKRKAISQVYDSLKPPEKAKLPRRNNLQKRATRS